MAGGTIAVGIASIAASTAGTGASIAANQLNMPYNVTMKMTIQNQTKWSATDGTVFLNGGMVKEFPTEILPASDDLLATHKTGNTATGTSGVYTLDMQVGRETHRIYLMWSVPYDQTWSSNWLGVGLANASITANGKTTVTKNDINYFSRMYYENEGWFTRKQFSNLPTTLVGAMDAVRFGNRHFEVIANLGSTHKAEGQLIIAPKSVNNYAPRIKAAIVETIIADGAMIHLDNRYGQSRTGHASLLKAERFGSDTGDGLRMGPEDKAEEVLWQIQKLDDRRYRLRNPETDRYLAIGSGGKDIVLADGDETDKTQQWTIDLAGGDLAYFRVKNVGVRGTYLSTRWKDAKARDHLRAWPYKGPVARRLEEQWEITPSV